MSEEEENYDDDEFAGLKKVNSSPSLDKIRQIPIGKCLTMETELPGGTIEQVEVCRKSETEWDVRGPHVRNQSLRIHEDDKEKQVEG